MPYRTYLFLLLFLNAVHANAQSSQFGVSAGLNSSYYAENDIMHFIGWHSGLHTGLFGKVQLGQRWRLIGELNYSQSGQYVQPISFPENQSHLVEYNYLEMPLRLAYQFTEKEYYYRNELSVGFAANYLARFKMLVDGMDQSDQFVWKSRTGISFNATFSHYFIERLGIDVRSSLALFQTDLDAAYTFRLFYVMLKDS